MKRDFASLTAQEALHVAIFIEERNAEIYHQFAEMFAGFRDDDSLEIASTFWDMAAEERRHGTELQQRYFDRYGTRPCAITAEQNAVRYYSRLVELTEEAELRELYREFSNFERDHTDFLEKKISEARRTAGEGPGRA